MSGAKILLVEDNNNCEELALRALRKAGFPVVEVVRDGAEALRRLLGDAVLPARREEQPSVVLLDLKLPKINGIDVLKRIRDDVRTKELKVIALSASEDPEELEICHSLGVTTVLTKPLDAEELRKSLTVGQ